jgi:hypothetical protein
VQSKLGGQAKTNSLGALPDINGARKAAFAQAAASGPSDTAGAASVEKKQRAKQRRKAAGGMWGVEANAPAKFRCEIDSFMLKDPVRGPSAQGSHVFERDNIEIWFEEHGQVCPKSGQPLEVADLTSDGALKTEISEWLVAQQMAMLAAANDDDDDLYAGM